MSRLSQSQKIVEYYSEDYNDKRKNPRFADDKAFISQIVAEIGSQKVQIVKNDAHVFWQDKPRLEFIGLTLKIRVKVK